MRTALITGASSGIGAAAARAFDAAGYRVALVARTAEKLAETAEGLSNKPVVEAVDAANGDAVLAMADRLRADFGVPDVIINNAGAGVWKYIEDTKPAEAITMMNAPYFAAFNVTHAFMSDMLSRRSGVLIHVNSPAAEMVWPSCTGYAAARFALRGLHEALSQDLAGTGVRSCQVIFGEVSSEYWENNPGSRAYVPKISKTIPVMTPEACARVLLRVAERPRRQVVYPFMLRLYHWNYALAPWLVRWLLRLTGRKRSRP